MHSNLLATCKYPGYKIKLDFPCITRKEDEYTIISFTKYTGRISLIQLESRSPALMFLLKMSSQNTTDTSVYTVQNVLYTYYVILFLFIVKKHQIQYFSDKIFMRN